MQSCSREGSGAIVFPSQTGCGLPEVESPEFAKMMLDLEGELAFKCTIGTVRQLLGLYSRAIEFYAYQHNLKHLHYQERMQTMLARKDVRLVVSDPERIVDSTQNEELLKTKKEALAHYRKLASKQLHGHQGPELHNHRVADQALRLQHEKEAELSGLLQRNIKNQCLGLGDRLKTRQQRRISSTGRFREETEEPVAFTRKQANEVDVSGGHQELSKHEIQLENIVEQSIKEKLEQKTRIRQRYSGQLSEIEAMGNQGLLEELNTRMQQEIAATNQLIEQQKNEKIHSLRQESRK